MNMSQFLTVKDVSLRLRVNRFTIYRWLQTGKLRALKLGGQWRVHPYDLRMFIRKSWNTLEEELPDEYIRG